MGHWAKVNDKGIVEKVIVAEAEFFQTFVDDTPGTWVETSYHTYGGVHYQPYSNIPSEDQSKALRKNYAGIGDKYDPVLDAFYAPTGPYPSWILDTNTCTWKAPTPLPEDYLTVNYDWNEESLSWVKITLP
jgi:hypothetical protein